MNPVKELLEKALAKLDNGNAWCKFAMARTVSGRETTDQDPTAVSWCASGAIYAVCPLGTSARAQARQELIEASPRHSIVATNDYGTFEDVRAMYEKAIERCSL